MLSVLLFRWRTKVSFIYHRHTSSDHYAYIHKLCPKSPFRRTHNFSSPSFWTRRYKCILAIHDYCFFKHLHTRVHLVMRACDQWQCTKVSTKRQEGELSFLPMFPLIASVDLYGQLPPGWNGKRKIGTVFINAEYWYDPQ